MSDVEKLLLNEKEAANLLGMSTHFLRRDRISDRSAGIPFIRIGSAIRYRRVDLEAWITEQIEKVADTPKILERPGAIAEKRGRGRPKKVRSQVLGSGY